MQPTSTEHQFTPEWTPGPWEVIGGPVTGTWHVAAAYDWGGHIAALESAGDAEEANARLIAAAPELLTAIRGFVDAIDDSVDELSIEAFCAYGQCVEAIAKATGVQS